MGEEIKSALEIAMEKVEKLGGATEEERLKWKYIPEGEKLAARYLKQDLNLLAQLGQYEENARKYITEGAGDILIRNINLPKNDLVRRNNKKAMDGLKTLKNDKVSVENVYSRMRRIFDHYIEQGEQQRKQAYESLKTEFEAKIQEAVKQQLGSFAGIKIDIESQPQFQEEWRKLQAQLDLQYIKLLDEYKQELSAIP
jgi:RNase P/RNase MRP subunit p30